MDEQKGKDRPYIGSVRFYKHMILTVLALIIIVPICTSIVLYYQQTTLNEKYEKQNTLITEQAERIKEFEILTRPVIEMEKNASQEDLSDTSKINDRLDWNLRVVNNHTGLPEDFTVKLEKVQNGQFVDTRIAKPLEEMLKAAADDGIALSVYSSYRSAEKQQNLFQTSVSQYMAAGDNYNQAFYKTKRKIALPSESEHQTGLMVDITAAKKKGGKKVQPEEESAAMEWLVKNCADYGFIQRYPEGKTEITGIDYEPYCYRYVGEEAARVIMESGITLEEYVSGLTAR